MISQNVGEGKVESVDIKEYIAVLLKRKWLVLICFLLSMAGTTAFLFTRQAVYRANVKLLVTKAGTALPSSDVSREDDRTFFGTQVDIMKSQTMLRRVQQRMKKTPEEVQENLRDLRVDRVRNSDIVVVSVDSTSRDFAKDFGNTLVEEYLRLREEQRAQSSESALLMLTREINRLSQELKAANERTLTFARENNLGLADRGNTFLLFRQRFAAIRTIEAVRDLSVAQSRKQLLDSFSDASSVLAILQTPSAADETLGNQPMSIVSPSFAGEESVSTGSVSLAANDDIRSGDFDLAQIESQMLRTDGNVNPAAFSAVNDVEARRLFEFENQRRSLLARLGEIRQSYKPKHPALIEAEQQLAAVNDQIEQEIQFLRDKANVQLQLAQERYELLRSQVESLNEEGQSFAGKSVQLRFLNDDVERVKTLYNAMLSQLMKLDVSQGFSSRTVSILEPAIVERDPVYPKKTKGLIVAAFFGLGLGLALAFFIEYIDDSIKLAEEVERDLQLPFLGMIPAAQWDPDDLTAHRLDKLKQQGGVSESYRVVRSAIIFSTPHEKLRSILVTSAVPREGKTTTCVNLAIGFSQVEDRVLLVDGDLRRGEVHKYFGVEKDNGLADLLLGSVTTNEVIKHVEVPNLDVITCGTYPANPAELLLGWRLKEFLDWAYKNYDRVIVDCPPVMGIADSAILGSAVDGVLFVIWAGRTSRRYVRVAKMTAVSRGAKIFGFVLNNLEPGRVGYYHYYPYYYSYYSRGYYYAHKEDEGKGGDIKGIEVPTQETGKDEIEDVY